MNLKKVILTIMSLSAIFVVTAFKRENVLCKTIAITQIVEHPALNATYNGIIDELQDSGFVAGKNFNLIFESAQGDPITATQIAQKFSGLQPSVIVALGTTSAQTMKQITAKTDIPVVFSSITDPLASRLVKNLKAPESNLTGQSNWVDIEPQFRKFQEILPLLKNLGVIYNPGEANSVSMLKTIKSEAKKMGINIVAAAAPSTSEVPQATRKLVKKVDAIFVSNDNTALSAFESIISVANNANIPVFVSDTDMVERGATAALGPNQYEIGRQTGKMVVQILGGARPQNLAVGFPQKTEFVVNMNALAAIRLAVPERTINEANFLIPARG